MRVVIIIPTYEERENIGRLIRELQEIFQRMTHTMHILVVDDNSPDGTATLVEAEARQYANIALLTGPKEGLGAAYIRGMQHVLQIWHVDAVMQMDADFSHKPADMPRLIAALEAGADFVIGSRYVPGGTIPADWGWRRRLLSRWGNLSVRTLCGFAAIHDCTAGFRAIRVSLLEKMDLAGIAATGYAFQVALLQQALSNHAVVREVPVEFVNRCRGETKLGCADILESFQYIWRLRPRKKARRPGGLV